MLSFQNDYNTGAHPKILERLIQTNLIQTSGYGTDDYCKSAAEKIKAACNKPDAEVRFLVGGTQTNMTVIASMLKNYEAVISAESGHINVHESGAVEYTGHKVISLPQNAGKINHTDLLNYLDGFYKQSSYEHMAIPGMVYISHPTEYGTLYTKQELKNLSEVCRKYSIPLFLDGARLGYALMSRETDVKLSDIADLCDVFYIGGTKVGALCGEAVVFTGKNTPNYLTTSIKQHGALLAKGRLLGIQFDTLFTDNLYFQISRHAIDMANLLKQTFINKGYRLFTDSPTNQQFIIMENNTLDKLKSKVIFEEWEPFDESHTVVRFVTSWSTNPDDIKALSELL